MKSEVVQRHAWWWSWLLLAAFVLAVLNLLTNGWQLAGYRGGVLFLTSNLLSMVVAAGVMVWSLVELILLERQGQRPPASPFVTTWVIAIVLIIAVDLWTMAALRGM